jgi:hypothetical protein
MYTLRTLETDGREVNLYLGNHYTLIKKDSVDKEHFNFELETFFGNNTDEDKGVEKQLVKSFIDAENLPNSLPIFWNKSHYIVNEYGKTFQKL